MKLVVVWSLAALLGLDGLYNTLRGNKNAGVWLLWALALCLAGYGLFHRRVDAFTQQGAGLVLKWLLLAGVLLFALLALFLAVLGGAGRASGHERAIIVLGAGLKGAVVSDILRQRLMAALRAHRGNPSAPLVVSGGQGRGEAVSEALAMRDWLAAQGVPVEEIIMEDKSVSTETNLQYSARLLRQRGIGPDAPVALVTNRFHCYRARAWAKRLGYQNARTLPAGISPFTVLPNYLREVMALVYMWLKPNNNNKERTR